MESFTRALTLVTRAASLSYQPSEDPTSSSHQQVGGKIQQINFAVLKIQADELFSQ